MANYNTTSKKKVHKINPSSEYFNIITEFIIYPRAAIHVSQSCPDNYRNLIEECVKHGWIQPVAYMSEREMLFAGLTEK